jgi:hypothetical protein
MRNLFARSAALNLSVVALLMLLATFSRAQDLASITGTVTDASGAVVSGATVVLQNPAKSASYKAVTN